jgi:hypothetical protein
MRVAVRRSPVARRVAQPSQGTENDDDESSEDETAKSTTECTCLLLSLSILITG